MTTPETWARIERIFQEALGCAPHERASFLAEACEGDESLRQEVESLLAHDGGAAFLSSPAVANSIGEGTGSGLYRSAPVLTSGGRIGPYEIQYLLGVGGMGEVYKARDTRLGRTVAIKVLSVTTASHPQALQRLEREARAVSTLNHPHICTLYDIGQDGGKTFLVMEFLQGETVAQRLANGPVPTEEALRHAREIADALDEAHRHGIVHRDLTPRNVILTETGAKLLDFGLAKLSQDAEAAVAGTRVSQTQPGAIAGTAAYMSPEQFRGEPADARSDVWAFGVLLYELTTGARPFTGPTEFALASAVMSEAPAPLPTRIPVALQTVVTRCLEKEPARRYQHGGEVRAALGMGASQPASGRRRVRLVVAGLAAGLMIAAAALVRFSAGAARPATSAAAASAPVIRLAVLPFENLTGDRQQDYFSDGLTEELITQLGGLAPQRLRVIARTSIMRYKSTSTPVDQIGRELGVDYVLGGSARRDGARVRVSAQLVQVRDQAQMWSETYDRTRADILALQNEVAQRVARGLALQLLPTEQRRPAPVDPEAYDLYLQGRAQLNSGPLALDRSQQFFELALKRSPTDASSYAGIAAVWNWRGIAHMVRGKDAAARLKAAALKAVELDDTLADSHTALATSYMSELDWPRAEAEFKRALALNPNNADGHMGYGILLMLTQHFQDANRQVEWALTLDPLNGLVRLVRGLSLLAEGRPDDAIRELRPAMTSTPGIYQFHFVLWRALHNKANDKDALAEIVALDTMAGNRERAQVLGKGYAEGGYQEAMHRAAAMSEARAERTRPLDPFTLALMQHDAGNRERAFAWMEQALEDGDPNLHTMGILMPDLKGDPRFRSLMQRMGLPY